LSNNRIEQPRSKLPGSLRSNTTAAALLILNVAAALRATATAELSYRLINFLPLCRK